MQPFADALDSAVPRLQQFRVRYGLIAAAQNFNLLVLAQLVTFIAQQLATMFLEPKRQTLPFLGSQLKNR
jgi:hypothetical protein